MLDSGLKDYFGKRKQHSATVIRGLKLSNLNNEKSEDHERDVIIMCQKTNLIVNIEAKSKLTNSSGGDAKRQFKISQEILQENFRPVFSEETNWKFASLVYSNDYEEYDCQECKPYVLNKDNLERNLDGLFEQAKGTICLIICLKSTI